jgi:hypothetical protein
MPKRILIRVAIGCAAVLAAACSGEAPTGLSGVPRSPAVAPGKVSHREAIDGDHLDVSEDSTNGGPSTLNRHLSGYLVVAGRR